MSKKRSKAQLEQKHISCWIEVFMILLIMGIILVNSLCFKGYISGEISYESGGLVADVNGYTVEGNVFQYTGDENSYVQIVSNGYNEQLLLAFGEEAQEDTNVVINYVDDEGNVLDIVSEGVWKKGKGTAKIDLEAGEYNSYLINILSNFSLSKVYYAADNGYAGMGKGGALFIVVMFVGIMTLVIMCVDCTRKWVEATEKRVIDGYKYIKKNAKLCAIKTGIFVGIILLGILVAYILGKTGKYIFSYKICIIAIGVSAIAATFIVCYKAMAKKIEVIACVTILLIGGMFAFTEPANVGISWDDEIHFQRAVQLSHLFDEQISAADATIMNDYAKVALEKRNYNRVEQKRYSQLLDELEASNYYVDRGGVGLYLSIPYIPSAIGLIIGRGIGLSYYATLALGRWMNTVLLAILCYFAMKKLKTGKIVVLLIALIPTNIFLAGNYSYDTWLTAWSILGLSTFFGEWQRPEKKMDKITPWIIGVSMYLAVLPKQVYFPLTFIALFLPLSKFNNKKECWTYRLIILASAILPFVMVYINNIAKGMGKGDVRGGEAVDATSQMDFVRSNPVQAGKILLNYLKGYLNPLSQGPEYITKMAYFGYSPMNVKFLLGVLTVGACVSREEGETKFPWWTKLGTLVVYAGIGFIAAFSMYVAFTAVASETVAGCQGRYIMPALFPVLYVCSRFSAKTRIKNALREENINILLLTLMLVGSIWGLWTGCIAFY